jgi:hypothetical protein
VVEEEVRMMTMTMDGLDDSNDFCNSFSFSLLDGVLVALALGMAWHGWSGFGLKGKFSYLLVLRHESL